MPIQNVADSIDLETSFCLVTDERIEVAEDCALFVPTVTFEDDTFVTPTSFDDVAQSKQKKDAAPAQDDNIQEISSTNNDDSSKKKDIDSQYSPIKKPVSDLDDKKTQVFLDGNKFTRRDYEAKEFAVVNNCESSREKGIESLMRSKMEVDGIRADMRCSMRNEHNLCFALYNELSRDEQDNLDAVRENDPGETGEAQTDDFEEKEGHQILCKASILASDPLPEVESERLTNTMQAKTCDRAKASEDIATLKRCDRKENLQAVEVDHLEENDAQANKTEETLEIIAELKVDNAKENMESAESAFQSGNLGEQALEMASDIFTMQKRLAEGVHSEDMIPRIIAKDILRDSERSAREKAHQNLRAGMNMREERHKIINLYTHPQNIPSLVDQAPYERENMEAVAPLEHCSGKYMFARMTNVEGENTRQDYLLDKIGEEVLKADHKSGSPYEVVFARKKVFFMLLMTGYPLLLFCMTLFHHRERHVLKQEISSLEYQIEQLSAFNQEPALAVDNCWVNIKASMGTCSKSELGSWRETSSEVWDHLHSVSDWVSDAEEAISQSLRKTLYPDSSKSEE